jgi:hypothetical protein
MKFDDWGWFNDDNGQAAESAEKPMAPDGRHVCEIVKAVVRDVKFKVSDDNPNGTSLCVDVAVPNCQVVEAIIPLQMRGLVEAVCRSASVPLPQRGEDWSAKQLEGRTVSIDTIQGIGKSGRQYVRIEKWHKGTDPLPEAVKARAPAARTQAAKAHKEFVANGGGPDDIPF